MTTYTTNQPTRAQLVQSLRGAECPACGKLKRGGHTLCRHCYQALPAKLRQRLYQRLGDGYEQAFDAALRHLGVQDPQLPGELKGGLD